MACSFTPRAEAAGNDARYADIAKAYFERTFQLDPVGATSTGVHAYDRDLGASSPAHFAASLVLDRATLARLERLDPASLAPRVALDRTMLVNALDDDLLVTGTMQTWKHQPGIYVANVSNGLYSLISRDFAPASVRLQSAIAREDAARAYLDQARASLTSVDAVTAAISVDDAAGTVDLIETTVPQAFARAGTPAQRTAFARSTRASAAAMRRFAAFVRRRYVAHPRGTFAIGAAFYAAKLKYEEGITLPLDAFLRIGVDALAQTRARMVATAYRIDPHASVQTVVARTMQRHPTAGGLMPAAQADLGKLRAFVISKKILDLPPDADITVTPTPAFARATVVAQMDAPGPLERVATQAYYNVTPVDPRDSKADQQAYLETFNDDERPIVSAHEVYPGHYANYIIDKQLPLSLTERMLGALSFIEGWAHYDEQMIVDEGWGNGDPRVRLMQLKEAILRNARYVVGVKLHTQGMTLAQAEHFFERQAFLDPTDARIESLRGTQDPTYGYYTLGKLEILKLRADYRKKMGRAFTLAGFHAALLSYGSPPIPLLRPLLLGADDDGAYL